MSYGMCYQGSKSRIAEKIVDFLPGGEILFDLFGGGGAISHCAALSGKWGKIVYNELSPIVFKTFSAAVNGEIKYRWVSREEFYEKRESDPLAAGCYSFGGDFSTYAFSPENEKIKRLASEMLALPTLDERRKAYRAFIKFLIEAFNAPPKKESSIRKKIQRFTKSPVCKTRNDFRGCLISKPSESSKTSKTTKG